MVTRVLISASGAASYTLLELEDEYFFDFDGWEFGIFESLRMHFIFFSASGVMGHIRHIRGLLLWQISSCGLVVGIICFSNVAVVHHKKKKKKRERITIA